MPPPRRIADATGVAGHIHDVALDVRRLAGVGIRQEKRAAVLGAGTAPNVLGFGHRIRDNGTDHGSGGVAFVVGTPVQGGTYGEYPSLRDEDQLEGDLHFTNDFRSTYSTLVDRWLGLDPVSITNGTYEQFDLI